MKPKPHSIWPSLLLESKAGGSSSPRQNERESNSRKRRKILILDNDLSVMKVLRRALERKGYLVTGIVNGEQAFANLSESTYDLILCDIQLPGLSGPEFYQQVEVSYPALHERFIFTSGDAMNPEIKNFIEETGSPFLKKPFELEELYKLVSAMLSESKDR